MEVSLAIVSGRLAGLTRTVPDLAWSPPHREIGSGRGVRPSIGTRPSKERRYRITDSYLRFWLTFLQPHLAEIDRMRSDLTKTRIDQGWATWRGRAVEPLIRESLARLLPAGGLPAAPAIGGYWTRGNEVEIDIVGADREPVAKRLLFLGSIKWLESSAFDQHDLLALQRHRDRVTDEALPLLAVSRSGVSTTHLDAAFAPADLLSAWPTC